MRVRAWAIALTFVLWPLVADAASISGTYIAKFSNAVELLQIVETPDHHVTGQMQIVAHTGDGKVENTSHTVTGAVDGSNVSLELKGTFLLSEAVTAFGTFDAAKLILTGKLSGSQPSTLAFTRSEAQEFDALVKKVNEQAQNFLAARAETEARQKAEKRERDFVSGLNALVQTMEQFDGAVDSIIAKLPTAEQRYHAITAQMTDYLRKERSLIGRSNSDVARSQISVAITQGSIATEQVRNGIQPTYVDFENRARPLMKRVTDMEATCQADATNTEARNAACHKFQEAAPIFQQHFDDFARNLAHLEEVYQKERATQEQLVSEAARIE